MSTFADHEAQARAELAAALWPLDADQRIVAMRAACIETGGSIVPAGKGNWGPHFAEISCLGIFHSGNDMPEAIANWIKAVYRMSRDTAGERAAMVTRAMEITCGRATCETES